MDLLDCAKNHIEMMRDRELDIHHFRNQMASLSHDLARYLLQIRTLKDPVLVPILRAGLGMLYGAQLAFPQSEVGFLGIKRYEGVLGHELYYKSLPNLRGKDVVLLDPMLATGGSLALAAHTVEEGCPGRVIALCAVAAPQGRFVAEEHGVQVICGVTDEGLDDDSYIVPGLGDAGDRLYGVDA